jgi:hypothetical protein
MWHLKRKEVGAARVFPAGSQWSGYNNESKKMERVPPALPSLLITFEILLFFNAYVVLKVLSSEF